MGKNKDLRNKIAGLQAQMDLHEQKIEYEKNRSNPDSGLIRHWEKEIKACRVRRDRLKLRLPQKGE